MHSVFSFLDYKEFLRSVIYADNAPRGIQSAIAKAAQCQVAYLNQTINGKPHLSQDHGYRIADYLKMSPSQKEYFLDLIRLTQAQDENYRNYLKERLKETQEQSLRIVNNINGEPVDDGLAAIKYYSDVYNSVVHMLVFSPEYQTIKSISERLKLKESETKKVVSNLIDINILKMDGDKVVPLKTSMHLPENSFLNQSLQLQRRTLALNSIKKGLGNEQLHYSSIFMLARSDYEKLKAQIIQFISEAHKTIEVSPSEDVYSLCIDAFAVEH